MGRKIPAKKHRGVKDPLKQQEKRLQSLKGKINLPPSDPDEQPVPRSLVRLMAPPRPRPPHAPSRPSLGGSKRRGGSSSAGAANPVRALTRGAGEDGRAFSLRIAAAARALRDPHHVTYPADEDGDGEDARGDAIAALRARRRKKAHAAGAGRAPATERPTRGQRRRAVQKQRAQEAAAAAAAEARTAPARDAPAFGEVAHEPPRLPNVSQARRGLLMSALLTAGGGGGGAAGEEARVAAVAAYRDLKRQARLKAAR